MLLLVLRLLLSVAYIWVGARIVRVAWRILRKVRYHPNPFEAAACGTIFLLLGLLEGLWLPYWLCKEWWA